MGDLQKMLHEFCPDGVPYKTIGEIAEVGTGSSNGNEAIDDGDYPFFVRSQTIKAKDDYEYDEEAIIIPGEGGIGEIFHYVNGKYALHQRVYRIHFLTEDVNVKFAYYYMQANFKSFILKKAVSATVTSIRKPMVEGFPMPIPPLPVQSELVRLLDNFTESSVKLISDIEKERTLRKKQYLEYSHTLFTQSDCVKRTTLGEIVDICMCKRIMKAQTDTIGDVPFYQNGTLGGEAKLFVSNELFQNYSQKYKFPDPGDVMLSTVGTVGKTIQYDGAPAYFQDSNIVWLKRKTEDITNEYLYWFCVSMPWKLPERATLKHLHNYMIAETEISIPSKERQEYVIAKFQELEQAFRLIDTELTAEIEARQSQYEFYRDRLLTFEVKG